MTRLIPTGAMPEIAVGLAGGGQWRLRENPPAFMLMIDVYRGLHCPRCRRHLEALDAARAEFDAIGLDVIGISTDSAERAAQSKAEWNIPGLRLGFGLPVETARALGLFVSRSIREGESDVFAEPGVFFVRPDLTLYGAVINSFPFARPSVADLLEVGRIVRERGYPPRGDLAA